MKSRSRALGFALTFAAFASAAAAQEWRALFDGKSLDGWDTYLGPRYSVEKGDFDGEPVGLDRDPRGVFSVVAEDGEPAIRISGAEFGGISTVDAFENYHLQLQFKWGEARHAPRADAKRDSGLLYHAVGPHAADWFFWMRSQEFQVQEGDCGDYWGLVGASVEVRTRPISQGKFLYDPQGEPRVFGSESPNGRQVVKHPDGEYPNGEWNTLDLYCLGDASVHVVNGVVTMVLRRSSMPGDSGPIPLTRGKLQIQSEGAEVFYRRIQIRQIEAMPPGLAGE